MKYIFFRNLYKYVPSLRLSDVEAVISNGLKSVVTKCFEPAALSASGKETGISLYYCILSFATSPALKMDNKNNGREKLKDKIGCGEENHSTTGRITN